MPDGFPSLPPPSPGRIFFVSLLAAGFAYSRPAASPPGVAPLRMEFKVNSLASARAMFAHFQAAAEDLGLTLPAPPPHPTTCCGRGCEGCVWHDWYAEVATWRQEAERLLRG
jgi:hypothetical protein